MTNCNNIKRLIDEAEQPDLLPFEATNHLNSCTPCRLFADERASLRGLLNTVPRVNAPFNFDAQLKARLATAKAKPSFAWLSPALYLRFGAASAALLLAVFVAQYNGMFSPANDLAATGGTSSATASTPTQTNDQSDKASTQGTGGSNLKTPATPPEVEASAKPSYGTIISSRSNRRVPPVAVTLEGETMPDRVPGLIVRRSGREVELPMLPVSLGAQQQLINRSSRSSVQPIAISF